MGEYSFVIRSGNIRYLDPIFWDFITNGFFGEPLQKKNRIDLIWHEMKQTTEVKLEVISNEIGKTFVEIPWHGYFCEICKIYRQPIYPKTLKEIKENKYIHMPKYYPPRFAHELDADMILTE